MHKIQRASHQNEVEVSQSWKKLRDAVAATCLDLL